MAANSRRSMPGFEKATNSLNLVQGVGKAAPKRRSIANISSKIPIPSSKIQAAENSKSNRTIFESKAGRNNRLEVITENDMNIDEQEKVETKKIKPRSSLISTANHNLRVSRPLICNKDTKIKVEVVKDSGNVKMLEDGNTNKILESKAPNKKSQLLVSIAEETKVNTLSIGQDRKYSALVSPFPLPPNVICIDEHDDSTLCYTPGFMNYLKGLENFQKIEPIPYEFRVSSDRRRLQPRIALTDWLIEVTHYFKTSQECLYQTINLLDRVLANSSQILFATKDIQLVGITCLYIGTKLEEYYPADPKELVRLTENSWKEKEIIQMEFKILAAVNLQPVSVDPMPFVNRFIEAARRSLYQGDNHSPIEERSFYELCIFNVDCLVTNYKDWEILPSKKAAAAVYSALKLYFEAFKEMNPFDCEENNEVFNYDCETIKKESSEKLVAKVNKSSHDKIWNATLSYYSGYSESQINELANQMLSLLKKVRIHTEEEGLSVANGLKRKYLSVSRHEGLLKRSELSVNNIDAAILNLRLNSSSKQSQA